MKSKDPLKIFNSKTWKSNLGTTKLVTAIVALCLVFLLNTAAWSGQHGNSTKTQHKALYPPTQPSPHPHPRHPPLPWTRLPL